MKCANLILGMFMFGASGALAQPTVQTRCAADQLDPTQAKDRLEWARKCGHKVHAPGYFDTGNFSVEGPTLKDYWEDDTNINFWGQNTYSGLSFGYEVNNADTFSQFKSGPTHQGTAENKYYWWRDSAYAKLRPEYPTFGNAPGLGSTILYPPPGVIGNKTIAETNCNFYYDAAGTRLAQVSFYISAYCVSSCYTPEQQLLFPDGQKAIIDAKNELKPEVMTLHPESTLDSLKLQNNKVFSYIEDVRDARQAIFEITTASGGHLRLTDEHPVVQGEGRLVQAKSLKVGDDLIKIDGTPDPIVSINKIEYYGKTYNIRPATDDRVSNILVAQGYLVGSALFQNEDIDFINRIILHRSVPVEVLPK